MAVKLYRIINASKTHKGRAAWRLDEVMYPASLPCNPVTPDELQAAIWKQLDEESWETPPRAWGRPGAAVEKAATRRNTPTSVGKTA